VPLVYKKVEALNTVDEKLFGKKYRADKKKTEYDKIY
jgi:hypothetical protein